MAIEALHKASLVHDDIEDDDDFRYGKPSLHREYGVGPALNVGDYLIGLGYKLIASQADELGADCVADILANLSAAHIQLCRGQGAELMWQRSGRHLHPIDALSIYAMKTAPAFETALFAGLRAANAAVELDVLRRYTNCVGEAYQILNDLDGWRRQQQNKVVLGQDAIAGRPTILHAFALQAGGGKRLAALAAVRSTDELVDGVKALYDEFGAFDRAEELLEKLKIRARSIADEIDNLDLRELLRFIIAVALKS